MPVYLQKILLEMAFRYAKPYLIKAVDAVIEEVEKTKYNWGSDLKKDVATEKIYQKIAEHPIFPGGKNLTKDERDLMLKILGVVVNRAVGDKNDSGEFKHKVDNNG